MSLSTLNFHTVFKYSGYALDAYGVFKIIKDICESLSVMVEKKIESIVTIGLSLIGGLAGAFFGARSAIAGASVGIALGKSFATPIKSGVVSLKQFVEDLPEKLKDSLVEYFRDFIEMCVRVKNGHIIPGFSETFLEKFLSLMELFIEKHSLNARLQF